jgi:hypothetical protein
MATRGIKWFYTVSFHAMDDKKWGITEQFHPLLGWFVIFRGAPFFSGLLQPITPW